MPKINLTPPPDWPGSKPEYYANWALTKLKIDFVYQYSEAGGRIVGGGIVADFFVESLNLIINIQSLYWHSGVEKMASDRMQRAFLEGMGRTVVWIDEEHILKDPLFYIKEALKGISHSF